MTKTISIANQKGGVGKTTTAIQISYNLSLKNYRVLMVDLDPQANATSVFLDISPHSLSLEETVYVILKDKKGPENIIKQTKWKNLYILPSTIALSEIEPILTGNVDGFFRLQDSLENIKSQFDFIIIDNPPNLGMLTINGLLCSDYVMIPLQAAKFSLDGIRIILETIQTLNKKFRLDIKILGALMTMYDERTTISKAMIEEMKKYIPVFSNYISRSVVVEEAHLMKEPLSLYSPKSKVTLQYQKVLEEILNGIKER
ncbi:MAG: chromosome partitioning protein ParA [Leptospiraceae bacterium]|nr:MAG: chromosome partitioning protein ParA [Leptospiraceae bacterium]